MRSRLSTVRGASALAVLLLLGLGGGAGGTAHAEEPPLPAGLEAEDPPLPAGLGTEEPDLPAGLGGGGDDDDAEPALPAGLGDGEAVAATAPAPRRRRGTFSFDGFADLRGGLRLQRDPHESRASLGEARLQLGARAAFPGVTLRGVADLVFDPVLGVYRPDLERGFGVVDLRELNIAASPWQALELKIGRQILTWGTGDLLFINDLFPKDWTALLIGRDVDYLKAPSDALKVSLYVPGVSLDVVYTPRFDADRYPDRRRISSWEPSLGRIAGEDAVPVVDRPERWFRDGELALRLSGRAGSWELAAYGYHGFWKSPAGADPTTGHGIFPGLSAAGASARGPLARGILSLEAGYYHSRDDRDGDDPLVRNSEVRALVGYEQELAPNLTGGFQYYVEVMLQHGGHKQAAPGSDPARHVSTARLTWLALGQDLQTSLFVFWGINERDVYLRPHVQYRISDHWRAEVAANLFFGHADHTFFGQFEHNTNAWAGARYSW